MGKWTNAQRAKFAATMKKKFGTKYSEDGRKISPGRMKKKYRDVKSEVKPLIKKTRERKLNMTVYYNEDGHMELSTHLVRNYNEAAHILYSEYAMHYVFEVRIVV